ncbi:hypothetical protein lerEdw1_012170 [Lerista edwardsae]|nr:hypothetical protein lerEdw1_012170 [Lerista edwardsae]
MQNGVPEGGSRLRQPVLGIVGPLARACKMRLLRQFLLTCFVLLTGLLLISGQRPETCLSPQIPATLKTISVRLERAKGEIRIDPLEEQQVCFPQ